MFNAWKTAWRNQRDEDYSQRPPPASQEPSGFAADTSAFRGAGSSVVPPAGPFVQGDIHNAASSKENRPGSESPLPSFHILPAVLDDTPIEQSVPETDRGPPSSKRRKLANGTHRSIIDTLQSSRLNSPVEINSLARVEDVSVDALFNAAAKTNIIVPVLPKQAKSQLLQKMLNWAAQEECRRFENGWEKQNTAYITHPKDRQAAYKIIQAVDNVTVSVSSEDTANESFGEDVWPSLMLSDVIVMSSELFLDLLNNGCAVMSQFNLLILEHAESAQHGHFSAQVMLDFYKPAEFDTRPKVLGFLGSNNAEEVDMLNIESTLNAKIFGMSEEQRTQRLAAVSKPKEIVVFYGPPIMKRETALFQKLRLADQPGLLKKRFEDASVTLLAVGPCAADLVWRRHALTVEAEFKSQHLDEITDDSADGPSNVLQAKWAIRDVLKNHTYSMPNLDPYSKAFNATPQFAKLVQVLACFETQGDAFRGLVFVRKRATAYAIADMLRTLGDQLPFLRPQVLVGHGSARNPAKPELTNHRDVLEEFWSGTTNLLVSTRVGEDGMDLPQCTAVVRYDLFENHISYAHSRARLRQKDSHLVLMVEQSNDVHRRIIHSIARLDPDVRQWIHAISNNARGAVPPRAVLEKENEERVESDEEDAVESYIEDPTTGGRIYSKDATAVVYRYSALVNELASAKPLFEFSVVGGQQQLHVCTVCLPARAPLGTAMGPPCSSKADARRLACYETCVQLFHMGNLDHTLFPRPPSVHSFLPDIYAHLMEEPEEFEPRRKKVKAPAKVENNLDANGEVIKGKAAGTRCYVRKRPTFWKNTLKGDCDRLFPTVIMFDATEIAAEPYRMMCILTRHPIPPILPFKLFFSGVPSVVELRRYTPIPMNEERMQDIHKYTIRICRSVSNKPLECDLERTPYFFAPLTVPWVRDHTNDKTDGLALPEFGDGIAWDEVALAASRWVVPLNGGSIESLSKDIEDAVFQDRWVEFTRRYYTVCVRPELSPLSKTGDDPILADLQHDNLLEYCKARRKGFEGLRDEHQPLIEASRVPPYMNRLNPASKTGNETHFSKKFLIPELSARFTIPASVFRTALLLPSIIRRIDDLCLVKELNAKKFDNWLNETTLHQALSAPSTSAEFDYERLELLGDAYLKYLSSIYLFVTHPTQSEGTLHVTRQKIISNRVLLTNARRADIPQFIQAKAPSSKSWIPYNHKVVRLVSRVNPAASNTAVKDVLAVNTTVDANVDVAENESANGDNSTKPAAAKTTPPVAADRTVTTTDISKTNKKRYEDTRVQWLGDKCVADVAEAIIGAACLTGGTEAALKVAKDVGCDLPAVDRWSDFGRKVLAPPPESTATLKPGSLEAIEEIIGWKIKRPHILAQALTHTSIQGNELPCYERLEFLGDAVLDYLVIHHMYNEYGQLSPGGLTLLKGSMVTNTALAAVCVETGLHEHIIHDSTALTEGVREYSKILWKARTTEYGLAKEENRMPGQYWADIDPPKALSDVIESLLGAILVCDNFAAEGTQVVYNRLLKPFYQKHITLKTLSHHPTKVLFELFQSRGCQQFEIVRDDDVSPEVVGPATRCDVICHDVILASATDTTAQIASRKCSFLALDALEGDPEFMTRTCDCRELTDARKANKKRARASNASSAGQLKLDADGDVVIPDANASSEHEEGEERW